MQSLFDSVGSITNFVEKAIEGRAVLHLIQQFAHLYFGGVRIWMQSHIVTAKLFETTRAPFIPPRPTNPTIFNQVSPRRVDRGGG